MFFLSGHSIEHVEKCFCDFVTFKKEWIIPYRPYLPIPEHLSAPNYTADLRQGVAVEYVSCEPTPAARELFKEDAEQEE